MSTRSLIGMERKPGGWIDFIYCHSDGYPVGVGAILQEHYQDPEKIKQLIALGSITSLGRDIGEKQDFNKPNYLQCNAYHRDRGEPWERCRPEVARTVGSLRKRDLGQSYCYVYLLTEDRREREPFGTWYYVPTGYVQLNSSVPEGWTPAWSKPGYVDPFTSSATTAETNRVLRITPEENYAGSAAG